VHKLNNDWLKIKLVKITSTTRKQMSGRKLVKLTSKQKLARLTSKQKLARLDENNLFIHSMRPSILLFVHRVGQDFFHAECAPAFSFDSEFY
jgi:hypothetical protein